MIILEGRLRQRAEVNMKTGTSCKVWVEHETPRENGVNDLKLEEIFLPLETAKRLPPDGQTVRLQVRVYPRGKGVAFAGIDLAEVSGKGIVSN